MKAVLRRLLDQYGLGGSMVVGVHDTDYFAKLPGLQSGQAQFELAPHNDVSTKELWSAAGEISRIFGSETYPTRRDYATYRVPLNLLARDLATDRAQFLDWATEAWGWRGLVDTGSQERIVHSLPLADMGDAVDRMLAWGFDGAAETVEDSCCHERAVALARELRAVVARFVASHPEARLSALYRELLPHIYEIVLGEPARDLHVDCTAHLLRLDPTTASLPRFAFLDLFLRDETRRLAVEAYNEAVAGTEMYTLDRFGLGALPFDVVLPKEGRGTLRVTLRAVHIETPKPIRLRLQQPIRNVGDLAAVLTERFGDHVSVVGKAVALVSMMAREFLFVFNEEGSAYVTRTRAMNDLLRREGVDVKAYPIVRLRYHTWDALGESPVELRLPEHLASAFGTTHIRSAEFAQRWRGVVDKQAQLLESLREMRSPRALLHFLACREGDHWGGRLHEYDDAKLQLRHRRREAETLIAETHALYGELRAVKDEIRQLERAKGDHFRATAEWTDAESARRTDFDRRISAALDQRRDLLARIRDKRAERAAAERSGSIAGIRDTIRKIEDEAAFAKLTMVRNAILTRTSLVHTNHRPTAWWLPMLDPSGRVFNRVVATTEVYTQPLVSE